MRWQRLRCCTGYVSETAADFLGLRSFPSAAASGKSHDIPLLWHVTIVFKSELPGPEAYSNLQVWLLMSADPENYLSAMSVFVM